MIAAPSRREFVGTVALLGGALAGCLAMPDGWSGEPASGPGENPQQSGEGAQDPPQQPIEDPVEGPADAPIDSSDDPPESGFESVELALYESAQYGYTVQYPNGWNVDERNPAFVHFSLETAGAAQYTQTFGLETPMPIEGFVTAYDETMETNERVDSYRPLARQGVTLPGGYGGAILDSEYRFDGVEIREKALLVAVDRTAYLNQLSVLAPLYTERVDDVANRISESLTVGA